MEGSLLDLGIFLGGRGVGGGVEGGEIEKIFGWWGESSPIRPSRENPDV